MIENEKQLKSLQTVYQLSLELVHVIDEDPDLPEEFRYIPKDFTKMMTDMRLAIVEYKNKLND